MSLGDTPPTPEDVFEMGDKLFTLPPNKINLVFFGKYGDVYMMNHNKYALSYYVQRIPPNPLTKPPELERLVVHFIPRSREDELVPR